MKEKILPSLKYIIWIFFVVIIYLIIFFAFRNNFKETNIDKKNITTSVIRENTISIVNLACFGVDTRETSAEIGDQNRSDSIMIVSINLEENTVKLISIMRDSKVSIAGYSSQKINAAYKYGGADLALDTLNKNFNLSLSNYITVDFSELAKIIDIIDGIRINLSENEAALVNQYAYEHFGQEKLITAGINTLNGAQAVSYSRIRRIDSDYQRVSRQQLVLNAILVKLKSISSTKYAELFLNFWKCAETNLDYQTVMRIVGNLNIKNLIMESRTVPEPEVFTDVTGGIDDTGSWVWQYDLNEASEYIHSFLFGKYEELGTIGIMREKLRCE